VADACVILICMLQDEFSAAVDSQRLPVSFRET